jgi:mannose-6-phosphate isomerase-like protein (cupin superfamily)
VNDAADAGVQPPRRREPYIARAAEAARKPLRHGRGEVMTLVGPETGQRPMDVHMISIRAGTPVGPYHFHSASDIVYVVVEGRVRARIDGKQYVLEPGDAAFIPAGVRHAAHNVGTGEVRMVEIYAPADPDFVVVDEDGR